MVLAAWMIGSITLLIVKTDEQTGHYRDTLKTLDIYSQIHGFDGSLKKRLRSQMKLYFSYRQLADEEVLKNFPTLTRRKVLKRLYLPSLIDSSLMKGVRQAFIDAFLCCCRVEIFSPGDELLQRGSNSTELYLLVEGDVNLLTPINPNDDLDRSKKFMDASISASEFPSPDEIPNNHKDNDTTPNKDNNDSNKKNDSSYFVKCMGPGHFINDISFFTNTPMMETVQTTAICKALTLPMAEFRMISEDFPGCVRQILQNLLVKMEEAARSSVRQQQPFVPAVEAARPSPPTDGQLFVDRDTSGYRGAGKPASNVGSPCDDGEDNKDNNQNMMQQPPITDSIKAAAEMGHNQAMLERHGLVRMHIEKLKDDQVARLLCAASRGDTTSITSMLDQGFEVNCCDYDGRTALMVSASKGCTQVVEILFNYHANPNLRDINGNTALFEAVRNGHDSTMDVIIENGGELGMDNDKTAYLLSKAILGGHTMTLRRLLRSKINVNVCGADHRRAVHVAAMSGNLEALKLLVEFGADLTVHDIWGNTVLEDAKKSESEKVLHYVQSQVNVVGKSQGGWFK